MQECRRNSAAAKCGPGSGGRTRDAWRCTAREGFEHRGSERINGVLTTRNKWQRPAGCCAFILYAAAAWAVADEAYLPRLGPSPLRFGDAYPFLTPPHLAADYDPRVELVPVSPATNSAPVISTNSPAPEPPVVRAVSSPRPEPVAITNAPPALLPDALDSGSTRSDSSLRELVGLFRKAVKTTNGVQEIIAPLPFVPGTPGEAQSSRATFTKP